jgi:hypothetical protein
MLVGFNCRVSQLIDAVALLLSLGASSFMLTFMVRLKKSALNSIFDAALGISKYEIRLF